jgi:ubiquinone/menaquinone biosynthesis C-methylase UbiE
VADAALETLREMLQVDGRDVLDVGCGEGGLVRRLASDGARAVGVDPLPVAVERARLAGAGVPGASYVAGTAEDLPFPEESFDAVIFFNSLHHVPVASMDAALSEAARVLRGGGSLYVQEPVAGGSAFELLRPVDDETEVRGAARDALHRAAEGTFTSIVRRELMLRVRYEDFDALRTHMVSVDPQRARALDEHEGVVRATFERLGRPVEGGYEFEQPLSVELMRR